MSLLYAAPKRFKFPFFILMCVGMVHSVNKDLFSEIFSLFSEHVREKHASRGSVCGRWWYWGGVSLTTMRFCQAFVPLIMTIVLQIHGNLFLTARHFIMCVCVCVSLSSFLWMFEQLPASHLTLCYLLEYYKLHVIVSKCLLVYV